MYIYIYIYRDINDYRELFRNYCTKSRLEEIFDTMHEMASMFTISPEHLRTFINEGKLSTLAPDLVYGLIKRRWDYKENSTLLRQTTKP